MNYNVEKKGWNSLRIYMQINFACWCALISTLRHVGYLVVTWLLTNQLWASAEDENQTSDLRKVNSSWSAAIVPFHPGDVRLRGRGWRKGISHARRPPREVSGPAHLEICGTPSGSRGRSAGLKEGSQPENNNKASSVRDDFFQIRLESVLLRTSGVMTYIIYEYS